MLTAGQKLKMCRCDGYMEFGFEEVHLVTDTVTKLLLSAVYTPEQNGLAEYVNRTGLDLPGQCFCERASKPIWAQA